MATTATSLLVLNDYCMDNIFVYFTLDELMLLFGNVHPLVDAAVERQLHRFPHIELSMRFPPQYDDDQKQAIGRHLHSFNVNVGYSMSPLKTRNIIKPFFVESKQGGRMRALKIQHTYIKREYLELISIVAPMLVELDLSRCDVDTSELMLCLKSATQLKTLALYNKDAAELEETLLSRLHLLKINWMVGTELYDVAAVSQKYPFLSIVVYQTDHVEVYGPPAGGKKSYFQDI